MLTVKYDRKDFFGQRVYTEDKKNFYTIEDIKKAFLAMGKDNQVTVQIDNVIYFWDNVADFDGRILLVRTFDKVNTYSYSDVKMAFDKVKREVYKRFTA